MIGRGLHLRSVIFRIERNQKCEERTVIKSNTFIRFTITALLATMLFTLWGAAQATAQGEQAAAERYDEAVVIKIEQSNKNPVDPNNWIVEQEVQVRMLSGPHKGDTITASNSLSGSQSMDINLQPGDKVIIYSVAQGDEVQQTYIAERVRAPYLKYFVLLFAVAVIAVGGIKGAKSLVGLGATMAGLYYILLPALLKGYAPLPVTIVVLIGVTILTTVMIAGFTRKAAAATLGTMGGVLAAGFLAVLAGDIAFLRGMATEEERILSMVENLPLDMQGLLFSGILIGAVGAIMDVAMSIASAIEEVRRANPELSSAELIRSGMRVGRDIMATMTDTLILAYAGGALPFLVLYMAYDLPQAMIMNSELIGSEVVRALAGSIGLIISVPITAVIASVINGKPAQ